MALKPWYKVVTPREDLRDDRPLDASEFAVHLDHVREGSAPQVYTDPKQFFARTFLTRSLASIASSTIRRLSGETTETSAVFNMSTQFGGGKTHALTLLYHLARIGPEASSLPGVSRLLREAGVSSIPKAATAVFVGTEFDLLSGRTAKGEPTRRTPWGEIAWQLGGATAFDVVKEHDEKGQAPAGDVIREFLPDGPCLILVDELMNYISRGRKSGAAGQLYTFVHNLSEVARGRNNVVVAVSIPASELEMTAEDIGEFTRFKKLLDRLGKAIMMSSESETSEIIRRRLFEWDGLMDEDGKVMLPKDAEAACAEYCDWVQENRKQLPEWFSFDHARDQFRATYPFHPGVLSVFERKWQALPRFQQTRGVLRLLALWVARAYADGFKGAHKDAMIGLGTAPLEDATFRTAVLEQLGEHRLEGAVTTDVCGKKDSHATRLDTEAPDTLKKARLHRKVATTIFFESNGGQAQHVATLAEVRLDVGEPSIDIGNVETALDALQTSCYFLAAEGTRYRFGLVPNLNKLLADRRSSITTDAVSKRVREEVETAFHRKTGQQAVLFPEKSNAVPDRAALTFVVFSPDAPFTDATTREAVEKMTKEYGNSSRTFKSALVWCVAESSVEMESAAKTVLAWEAIRNEESTHLDADQKRQLEENIGRGKRDLREAVWRAYKNVLLLGKDNTMRHADLGLVHSSAATDIVQLVQTRLEHEDDITAVVSATFLVRNWPPAIEEWPTKSVRDAFFASPRFPRLLDAEAVKDAISKGVASGQLAYVGKKGDAYEPFLFGADLPARDVEIADEMFIIRKEKAAAYVASLKKAEGAPVAPSTAAVPGTPDSSSVVIASSETAPAAPEPAPSSSPTIATLRWKGQIPAPKWMNFYTNVLTPFIHGGDIKLTVHFEVSQKSGISPDRVSETRSKLRDLGLGDDVETSE